MKYKLIILFILLIVFTGCAETQPHIQQCLEGYKCGFWTGLIHGMIAPVSFILSLFIKHIDVYAVNNDGSWYTFGFLLGVGAFTSETKKAAKK
jgi:hypothetical protein